MTSLRVRISIRRKSISGFGFLALRHLPIFANVSSARFALLKSRVSGCTVMRTISTRLEMIHGRDAASSLRWLSDARSSSTRRFMASSFSSLWLGEDVPGYRVRFAVSASAPPPDVLSVAIVSQSHGKEHQCSYCGSWLRSPVRAFFSCLRHHDRKIEGEMVSPRPLPQVCRIEDVA